MCVLLKAEKRRAFSEHLGVGESLDLESVPSLCVLVSRMHVDVSMWIDKVIRLLVVSQCVL